MTNASKWRILAPCIYAPNRLSGNTTGRKFTRWINHRLRSVTSDRPTWRHRKTLRPTYLVINRIHHLQQTTQTLQTRKHKGGFSAGRGEFEVKVSVKVKIGVPVTIRSTANDECQGQVNVNLGVRIRARVGSRHAYQYSVFTCSGALGTPPPAERGPSLESIYRVSLTVDLCEG